MEESERGTYLQKNSFEHLLLLFPPDAHIEEPVSFAN